MDKVKLEGEVYTTIRKKWGDICGYLRQPLGIYPNTNIICGHCSLNDKSCLITLPMNELTCDVYNTLKYFREDHVEQVSKANNLAKGKRAKKQNKKQLHAPLPVKKSDAKKSDGSVESFAGAHFLEETHKIRIASLYQAKFRKRAMTSDLIYMYNLAVSNTPKADIIIREFYHRMNLLGLTREIAESLYFNETQNFEMWKSTDKYGLNPAKKRVTFFEVRAIDSIENRFLLGRFNPTFPQPTDLSLSELVKITHEANDLVGILRDENNIPDFSKLDHRVIECILPIATNIPLPKANYKIEFSERLSRIGLSKSQIGNYWAYEDEILKNICKKNFSGWKAKASGKKVYRPYLLKDHPEHFAPDEDELSNENYQGFNRKLTG